MARDYKHRVQQQHYRRKPPASRGGEWRWLAAVLLVGGFAAFLIYLRLAGKPAETKAADKRVLVKQQKTPAAPKPPKPFEPTFDFYTILPEQEVVVPEPEIKTRAREESIGKSQEARYVMQAGSFRNPQDADKVKARLAMMGIEAKIETARNGATVWHRVKIGPLAKMAQVDAIRSRLRTEGIDAVVMQLGR